MWVLFKKTFWVISLLKTVERTYCSRIISLRDSSMWCIAGTHVWLGLEREGVPIITCCFSQLCWCDKYKCFDTWMILAEEGMYSHFHCEVFTSIICISVHYKSWRILCALIWYCMVSWKVTASLGKSTASIFRVKDTQNHIPKDSICLSHCTENLKSGM
jgi:hypothetical protein